MHRSPVLTSLRALSVCPRRCAPQVPTEPHASGGRLGEIYIFGGVSFTEELLPTLSDTYATTVQDDFWRLGVHECVSNCSNHGVCEYGFCHCYDGYFGVDCSNQSCPGDFCYWDEFKHEQVCTHCCYAGFHHRDGQTWQDGLHAEKVPCGHEYPGSSNGVCDGYGHCDCAPPFIGEDCSIMDCGRDEEGRICGDNGYCSVEFPISRCMCNPGYYGDMCQYRVCLNNCSYPRGSCNTTSGECTCLPVRNPYDNRKKYRFKVVPDPRNESGYWYNVKWDGPDCSYIMAYAASPHTAPTFATVLVLLLGMVGALVSSVSALPSWLQFGVGVDVERDAHSGRSGRQ